MEQVCQSQIKAWDLHLMMREGFHKKTEESVISCTYYISYFSSWHKEMVTGTLTLLFILGLDKLKTI